MTTRFTRLPLPTIPDSLLLRALGGDCQVEWWDVTGGALVLPARIITGMERLYKNGALLRRGVDYVVDGLTLTLVAPALASDWFLLDAMLQA